MVKFLIMSMLVFAQKQSSHNHGSARLSMAFEGKKGTLELHVPSESIYGFEYEAKSSKDRQRKEQGLNKLESKISEMVVFDPALKCEIKKDIFQVNQGSSHADIEAVFNVNCEQSPKDSSVSFFLQKSFPRLKTVQLEILVGDLQKADTVKKNGTVIELK